MGLIGFSHLILPCILQKHKSFVSVIMKKNTNHNEKIEKDMIPSRSTLGSVLLLVLPSEILFLPLFYVRITIYLSEISTVVIHTSSCSP